MKSRSFPAAGATSKSRFDGCILTTGDHFDLYDTSGLYTDTDTVIDLTAGCRIARSGSRSGHPP